jgi:hypothetical protein
MRRAISELAFGESLGNGDCGRRAFNIPTHDGVLATVSDTNPSDVPYETCCHLLSGSPSCCAHNLLARLPKPYRPNKFEPFKPFLQTNNN